MLFYLSSEDRPFSPALSYDIAADELAASFSLRGRRGVIVEDEGLTQLQLKKILRSVGVQVVGIAGNGQEAVEIVLRERPDFVLMDIKMPIMDGLAASERILAEYSTCIVMLTAFSEEEYRRKAQTLGACGYILKPITSETLVPELTEAVRRFYLPPA